MPQRCVILACLWLAALMVGAARVNAMPVARATFRIDAQLETGVWTSLRADIARSMRFAFRRGMGGSGPLDRVATTGRLEFGLRNHARNSGATQGWYSPNHANVRTGWTRNIPVRVVATYAGADSTLWRGKVDAIDPVPGKYGEQVVRVTAYDAMQELADTDVRSVSAQVEKTEVECLQAIIAAMPTANQPVATSYDTALDTFPYALYNVSGGVKAMTACVDVIDSTQGFLYIKADGTLRYENRHTRATKASDFTFDETTLDGIVVPTDLRNVYNDIHAIIHPLTTTAGTVLCAITSAIYVEPSQTKDVFLNYSDPNNRDRLIGASAFTTPLVAGTDYSGNSAEDGSGTDQTANLSVSVSTFAASAKFSVTNNGAARIYLVNGSGTPLLQLRGTALFDNGPQTYRGGTGNRVLQVDLKYSDDAVRAQDLADYLDSQYSNIADQVDAFHFNPQRSDALMRQALTTEIGDVKTVAETMTGISAVDVAVQAIEMEITPGDWLMCRFVTAPKGPANLFILNDEEAGVLDSNNLGYA